MVFCCDAIFFSSSTSPQHLASSPGGTLQKTKISHLGETVKIIDSKVPWVWHKWKVPRRVRYLLHFFLPHPHKKKKNAGEEKKQLIGKWWYPWDGTLNNQSHMNNYYTRKHTTLPPKQKMFACLESSLLSPQFGWIAARRFFFKQILVPSGKDVIQWFLSLTKGWFCCCFQHTCVFGWKIPDLFIARMHLQWFMATSYKYGVANPINGLMNM